jgi:hypothetical protein
MQDAPSDAAPNDPELGPMTHIDVPNTFQGWCSLVSSHILGCALQPAGQYA